MSDYDVNQAGIAELAALLNKMVGRWVIIDTGSDELLNLRKVISVGAGTVMLEDVGKTTGGRAYMVSLSAVRYVSVDTKDLEKITASAAASSAAGTAASDGNSAPTSGRAVGDDRDEIERLLAGG